MIADDKENRNGSSNKRRGSGIRSTNIKIREAAEAWQRSQGSGVPSADKETIGIR